MLEKSIVWIFYEWFQCSVVSFLLTATTDKVLENMQSRASRVLVCSWLLLSVLLASLYSSKLTATLTANNQSLPITSVSDLVNQDRYTWGLSSGTAVESIFKVTFLVWPRYWHATRICRVMKHDVINFRSRKHEIRIWRASFEWHGVEI